MGTRMSSRRVDISNFRFSFRADGRRRECGPPDWAGREAATYLNIESAFGEETVDSSANIDEPSRVVSVEIATGYSGPVAEVLHWFSSGGGGQDADVDHKLKKTRGASAIMSVRFVFAAFGCSPRETSSASSLMSGF